MRDPQNGTCAGVGKCTKNEKMPGFFIRRKNAGCLMCVKIVRDFLRRIVFRDRVFSFCDSALSRSIAVIKMDVLIFLKFFSLQIE